MADKVPSFSPTPRKSKVVEGTKVQMDFPDALRAVMDGKGITKLEWQDPEFYICLHEDRLSIRKPDKKFYNLLVTIGDMIGTDWVTVEIPEWNVVPAKEEKLG